MINFRTETLPKSRKFYQTIAILIAFYLFWTIRGWAYYNLFSITDASQFWFGSITKFLGWPFFCLLMLRWWYPETWSSKSGLEVFNKTTIFWTVLSIAILGSYALIDYNLNPQIYFINSPDLSFRFLLENIAIGVLEEFLFRGFIQPFMVDHFGKTIGILIQAALFMMIHWCWWVFAGVFSWDGSLFIFGLGLFWGILSEISKSIYPSAITHFGWNYTLGLLGIK